MLLDLAAAVTVYVLVTLGLVAATASLDEAARTAVSVATFVLVLVGGPILVETLTHGRSLGKLACGLRVVRDDGGPIRFRHALVRGLLGVIEILMTFGVVACVASLVSARGRRLGDVFAGTLVVRERVPAAGQGGFVPPPPPWLAGRFSGLDLSAVPDGLWLAVRQYLTRMRQLDPQVGWSMAERLAADVAGRTGAPVPPGCRPRCIWRRCCRSGRRGRRSGRSGAEGPPRPPRPLLFPPSARAGLRCRRPPFRPHPCPRLYRRSRRPRAARPRCVRRASRHRLRAARLTTAGGGASSAEVRRR